MEVGNNVSRNAAWVSYDRARQAQTAQEEERGSRGRARDLGKSAARGEPRALPRPRRPRLVTQLRRE